MTDLEFQCEAEEEEGEDDEDDDDAGDDVAGHARGARLGRRLLNSHRDCL